MALLKKNREKIALLLLLLLTAFLTSYKIWNIGNANAYYTAAVQSMLKSWHNFFYASFDPTGFITVDKPALGLWLECLFALVFGVHGWSVALPQIICSLVSVTVLYKLVKKSFGAAAGLIAALILALTPIFIASTRSNNFDASLVMVCLLAVCAALTAAEKGSLKHLILSTALIGVGFNIKMLQAYLYLPAIYLVYFFTSAASFKKRLVHLLAATGVLLAISAAWCLIVDLTSAVSRPYIGSSDTNSTFELAFGYNGLARIFGARADLSDGLTGMISSAAGSFMNEGGEPGLFRLFHSELAGQISWMLPMAVLGIGVLILNVVKASKSDKKTAWRPLLLWLGLFVTLYGFFSVSRFFHRYYLIMFAPALAALSAIAVRESIRLFMRDKSDKYAWQKLLLPAGIVLTAGAHIYFLTTYYAAYAVPLVWIITVSIALSLAGLMVINVFKKDSLRLTAVAAAVGILGLLAAPAFWAYSPIEYGSSASLPYAGPSDVANTWKGGGGDADGSFRPDNGNGNIPGNSNGIPDNGGNIPGIGGNTPDSGSLPDDGGNLPNGGSFPAGGGSHIQPGPDSGSVNTPDGGDRRGLSDEMVRYMLEHDNGSKILLVVSNDNIAAPLILDYDLSVIPIGGFSGNDDAISLEAFIERVKAGEIQYYWSDGSGQSQITRWVQQNGSSVDASEWLGSQSASVNAQSGTLYNLSGLQENSTS